MIDQFKWKRILPTKELDSSCGIAQGNPSVHQVLDRREDDLGSERLDAVVTKLGRELVLKRIKCIANA